MNTALRGLRIGCVQYLNAKPLVVSHDGPVTFEHPARLADMLGEGIIDVGLVPVYEALRRPAFPIADGVAIASLGAVYSVILLHERPLGELRTVQPDPASRTSNNLARCLLAEFHAVKPDFTAAPESDARVIIGNEAIRYRQHIPPGMQCTDLGEEWLRATGLPFVYAVWQFRPEVCDPAAAAAALRRLKGEGVARVGAIAREQADFSTSFAQEYLTRYIRFDLGVREKEGIALFRALLEHHALLPVSGEPLRYC